MVSAYLFLLHGSAKLLGGVLLVLGLFTRPVAFLLSGEMAVAYFMSHAKAAPRCCRCSTAARRRCCSASFLYLVFAGPGAWALDNKWCKRAA